jgi:hydroxymethylpyrimidine pyrophosphatase-like HAD family hydrolase
VTAVCVCADLDGTILDSRGELAHGQIVALLRLLGDRGHRFIVMTARNPYDVASLFSRVPFPVDAWCSDGACRVVVAGGSITDVAHEILLPSQVAVATVCDLLSDIERPQPLVFAGAQHGFAIFTCPSDGEASRVHLESLGDERPFKRLRSSDELLSTAASADVRAVSVIAATPVAERVAQRLPSRLGGQLHVYAEHRIGGYSWIDIAGDLVSKGASARALRDELPGVLLVAAGNGGNDVSLIEEADWTVCPADSCDEVRSRATLVLGAGASGGVGVIAALHTYVAGLADAEP